MILWILANIAAGKFTHTQEVVKSCLIDGVVNCLSDVDYNVKKEALWVIRNISDTSQWELCSVLVNAGCIKQLLNILEFDISSDILIQSLLCLNCILNSGQIYRQAGKKNPLLKFFEEANGLSIIERLQYKNISVLTELSIKMINDFNYSGNNFENGSSNP